MRLRPVRGPKLAGNHKSVRKTAPRSNITAKRLTIPPGFLSLGVKADAVKRTGDTGPVPGYDCDDILKENLHGLFRTGPMKDVKKSTKRSAENFTASTYFVDLTSKGSLRNESILQDRAKSVFKEIREKFREKQLELSQISPININKNFGTKLSQQIKNINLKPSDYYKKEIATCAVKINEILVNKKKSMSENRKRQFNDEDKENHPVPKFPYLPRSKWIFQTPPNRKLNYNHVKINEQNILPAVMQTAAKSTVVYEVDTRINFDLTKFKNNQEIDIDKRFMREVAKLSNDPADSFQFSQGNFPSIMEEDSTDSKFPQTDAFELEHHFVGLTCRPKKTHATVARIQNVKRKRDIFDPPQAGCSTDVETFNTDFARINMANAEESFTMKFTPTGCRTANTTGHMFDFTGNKKDTFNFHFEN